MSLEAKDIEQHIEQIRDERREGANTAKRVGSTMMEIFKYVASAVESAAWNIAKGFLRKDQDDETTHELTMGAAEVKGETKLDGGVSFGDGTYSISKEGVATLAGAVADYIRSHDFHAGTGRGFDGTGFGLTKNTSGKYTMELDNLIVRMKMIIAELEVHEMTFIGGTVVLSPCGNRMDMVERYNAAGGKIAESDKTTAVEYYRCYFLASDSTQNVKNEWTAGQLARCKTNNITQPGNYKDYQNQDYWRLCVGVSSDPVTIAGKQYHYVDLSNSSSAQITLTDKSGVRHIVTIGGVSRTLNSTPAAGDKVIGLGHAWDAERQNCALLSVASDDMGWTLYKGITHYDLPSGCIVNKFSISETIVTTDHYTLRPYAQPDDTTTALCMRGAYKAENSYGHNDLVSHAGRLWLCTVRMGDTVTGKAPGTDDAAGYWEAYTIKGDKGDKGDRGIQGLQGIQGPRGDQGIKGETGASGKTSYFHVKYSDMSNPTSASQMNETGGDYIGTYVDFTEADSTDPMKYTWVRTKGAQGDKGDKGIAGTNGTDGKTSYLHIAYANSADGKTGFDVSDGTGKTYIGQYTDFTEADSTDPKKYTWTLIKGEKGDKGDRGDKGIAGTNGTDGTPATVYTIEPWGSISASGTLKDANTVTVTVKGNVKAYKTTGDRKEEYSSQPQSWRLSIGGTNHDGTATFNNNAGNNIISFSLTQDYSISGTVPGSANIALFSDSSLSKQLASLIVPVSLNPGAIQDINAKLGTIQDTTTNMQNTVNGMHGTIETIRQGQGEIELKVQAIGRKNENLISGGNVAGMYMKRYEVWRSMAFTMVQGKTYTVTARIWKESGPNGHFMRLFVFGADNSRTYQYNSGYPLTNTSARVVRFKFEAGVTKEMVVGLYEQGGSTGSLLSGVHIDWCRVDEGDWTGDEVLDKWAPAASEVDTVNLLPDPAFDGGIAYSDYMGERNSWNWSDQKMGSAVSWLSKDSTLTDGGRGILFNRSNAASETADGLRYIVPFRGAGTYHISCFIKDLHQTDPAKAVWDDGKLVIMECHPMNAKKERITGGFSISTTPFSVRLGDERLEKSHTFGTTATHDNGDGTTTEMEIAYLEVLVFLQKNGCVRVSRLCLSKSDHYTYWNAAAVSEERKEETDLLATGIDIKSHKITATSDNFTVRNNSGDQTFSIDRDGNITGSGNASFRGKVYASGGEFTGTVTAAKIYGAYINGGSITGTTVTGSSVTSTSADGKSVTKITGGQLTTGTTNKLIIDTPGNEPGGVLRITQGSDDVVKLGVTDATGKAYADIKGAWKNEKIARNVCTGPYLMLGRWVGQGHGEDPNTFSFLSKNFMYVKHIDAEFLETGGMRMIPITLEDIDFVHFRGLKDIDEVYMPFHGRSQYNHPSELYFWNSSEITFDLGDPAEHDDRGLVKNAGRILFIWQMGERIIFKGTPNPTSGNTAACMYLGRKIRGETSIDSDCLGQLNILMSDGKHWVMHYMND